MPSPILPSSEGHGRLPSLDGLRAVAIGLVLVSHLHATRGFPAGLDRWLGRVPLVGDGPLGVRVFFVLSGYLITRLLLGEVDRTGTAGLGGFYRRRAVRILPVLWVYLAVVAALAWAGGSPLRPWQVAMPVTFTNELPCWPRGEPWIVAHTWSLAVEEQFYLAWPAVISVGAVIGRASPRSGRWRSVVLVGGGVLAVVLLAGPLMRTWIYDRPRQSRWIYTSAGHADMIGWGCLLAGAWWAAPWATERALSWRPALGRLAAAVVVWGAPAYAIRAFGLRYGWAAWSAQALAIAYLVGSVVHVNRGWSVRLLNLPPVASVGLASYGLYVWQQPFLPPDPGHGVAVTWWQQWPWNLACVGLVAGGSYWLVERPTRRLRGGRHGGRRSAMVSTGVEAA